MTERQDQLPVTPLDQPSMSVRVNAGEYVRLGRKVTVNKTIELSVDPPERLAVTGELLRLSDEQAEEWHLGTNLAKTLGSVDVETRLPGAIAPNTTVVRSADGAITYEEGTDYFIDHYWGGMCLPSSRIDPAGQVSVDYQVLRQRVDAVQVDPDGNVSLKKGESTDVCPPITTADEGCVLLARIYVPFRTTAIEGTNILQIPEDDIDWRDFISFSGREHLARTLDALENGKPVTIVCWGDSVTTGASAVPRDLGYVQQLAARLPAAYPKSEIKIIEAAIGGSSTATRLPNFDSEVLAHNPDLITVEFINDVWLEKDERERNWQELFDRARASNPNVEFIVITPNLMFPGWMHVFPAGLETMRAAAARNRAAIADVTHLWQSLEKVGIPYEALLANYINHPNNLGHELFTETLLKLLAR